MDMTQRHVWDNGTVTEMTVKDGSSEVEILDRSERLANGVNRTSRTIAETYDLAEEHDEISRQLRRSARQAYDNEQARKGN